MGNLCCSVNKKDVKSLSVPNKSVPIFKENWMMDGDDITLKNTVKFTFPIKGGRVIKVYDGDTITIAFKMPFDNSPLYRYSVRLNGIDTPEIKSKNTDEKIAAHKAQEALSALILNKYVELKNIDNEKYGRILADVYLGDLHINKWMIDNKFALPYDGGTKSSWDF